ncbi:uncharacterized protein At3g17950 [Ricinus communis]|uniref:Uncharacterized protein n=1 Tax=Ricinus communis TaxID=3988 RepID=B9SXS7_RICCO|nr:uncharacterized protein At3g17950 [Ricinus communis]EEF31597.1 conserved hypothetical protein [Ricinus communis]|eukprot:XP_002530796.1 uncharacterized protein At3g17950 [Ricinus communis]
MLDPTNDILPPPSSPTNSSISSSDLDTESTGSFFHDRSTTLGTLMGVTFPAITFRAPSQSRDNHVTAGGGVAAIASTTSTAANRNKKNKKNKRSPLELQRRRRWWRLCSDGESKPASLGEFLEVERRFGDGAFFGNAAAELEGVMAAQQQQQEQEQHQQGNGLFADGRVLPPASAQVVDDGTSTAGILCRFPVSLTGICSGGVG